MRRSLSSSKNRWCASRGTCLNGRSGLRDNPDAPIEGVAEPCKRLKRSSHDRGGQHFLLGPTQEHSVVTARMGGCVVSHHRNPLPVLLRRSCPIIVDDQRTMSDLRQNDPSRSDGSWAGPQVQPLRVGDLGGQSPPIFRRQTTRASPTDGQIGTLLADFETWWDLRSSGFPDIPAVDGERPFDPCAGPTILSAGRLSVNVGASGAAPSWPGPGATTGVVRRKRAMLRR